MGRNLQYCAAVYGIREAMEQKTFKPYLRASHKQLSYLAYLCNELNCFNRSLYVRYTMARAAKEIDKLKKRLDKQKESSRQAVLF